MWRGEGCHGSCHGSFPIHRMSVFYLILDTVRRRSHDFTLRSLVPRCRDRIVVTHYTGHPELNE